MGDKRFNIGLPEKLGGKLSSKFLLNEEFFEFTGDLLIEGCLLKAVVSVERKQSFWTIDIHVDGFIQTFCDRCGDSLRACIKGKELYFLKTKERNKNFENENIIFISSNKTDFNLRPILHEACLLLLPITRKHKPSDCNQLVISQLEKLSKDFSGQMMSSEILKDLKEKLKK